MINYYKWGISINIIEPIAKNKMIFKIDFNLPFDSFTTEKNKMVPKK